MINKNMTNEEIKTDSVLFPIICSGSVVVLDKEVTSNPEFTTLYLAGMVHTGQSSSSLSKAMIKLLGWSEDSEYIARCIVNSATHIADLFTLGQELPEFALRINDSIAPAYDGQQPRIDRNGKPYTSNGRPIYRNIELVTIDELAEIGHNIIKRDGAVQTQQLTTTSASVAQVLGA